MTPEEVRAWAEQKRRQTIEKLEAQRRGSAIRFILLYGVLGWGVPCGALLTGSQMIGKSTFDPIIIYISSAVWIIGGIFYGMYIRSRIGRTVDRVRYEPLGFRYHPKYRETRLLQLYGCVGCLVPNYLCSRKYPDAVPFFCMLAISGAVVGIWGAIRLANVLQEAKAAGLAVNMPNQKRTAYILAGAYALLAFIPVLTGGQGLFVLRH